jgi:hypothetical protein
VDHSLSRDELDAIAVEAYLYFYPMVLMEMTRRVVTNSDYGEKVGRGPMGSLAHSRAFPPGNFRTVVRPNFDTLYSSAWLDLSDGPYLVSVPAMDGRFFMLPCYDMWSEIFASPGTRTHGRGPLIFALCPRGWRGELPFNVLRIDAPTPVVWLLGRTETRGVGDYESVHALQDQIRLAPLSTWPESHPLPFVRDESVDMKTPPMLQVDQLSAHEFFSLAADLAERNPPHPTDWGMVARLARTGFVVGHNFSLDQYEVEVREAFEGARAGAQKKMRRRLGDVVALVNGWSSIPDMGVWGNAYLKRAMIALAGLGANPPEESIYPNLQRDADGEALVGTRSYSLRFEPGQLPPTDAFWSLTVYDTRGYTVENDAGRYALGDRDPLVYASDGSLEILLSHERPDEAHESNWLPVPEEPFMVTMRLYLPREEALSGEWKAPPALRVG